MGLCSSACFPFCGSVPARPAVVVDLPGRGIGATFVVHRESARAGNPWAPRDVQWTVTNAEGENWLFFTSNTDFEKCQYASIPWCIVRHYRKNLPGGDGGISPSVDKATGGRDFYDVLLVKLRLHVARGLVYASFHRKDNAGDQRWSSHQIASASWFVTTEAVERMGTQVAVEFRGEFRGETSRRDTMAALDWQLRRIDEKTLVLNHVNEPAVIIQTQSPPTVPSSRNRRGGGGGGDDGGGGGGGGGSGGGGGGGNGAPAPPDSSLSTTTRRGSAQKSLYGPSAGAVATPAFNPLYPATFSVHTSESEDPMCMLAMGFFLGSGVARAVRFFWEEGVY